MCLCWKVNRVLVQRSAKKIPLKTNQLPEIWGFLTTRELFYSHTKSFLSSRLPSEIRTPNTFHIGGGIHSLCIHASICQVNGTNKIIVKTMGREEKTVEKFGDAKKLKWSIKVIGGFFSFLSLMPINAWENWHLLICCYKSVFVSLMIRWSQSVRTE